ncbi:uncharacterized protein LOC127703082 isoform X1 [Mytilus californianus]|uniref:uncharacterized protein LOC127703082 isoform X1 n=1 Tax=Mytilus californianus TaxID=6549 RepID=UPI002246D7F1|nr:uncharacterized protein LOC127703082 isoform X1 [Mytilus californianus]
MLAATGNSPVSTHMVEQESGTLPVQTGKIKLQEFIVWKHKLFSVIHIVLGVALGIVSIIGMSCDIIAKEKHEDCLKNGHTLYSTNHSLLDFDIPCLICSVFYIITGLLPCCMTEKRKSNWRCLVHGFQLCSLIGSLVLAPTMAYLGYLGAIKRRSYNESTTIISVCIAGLFVAEWIHGIAIIVGSVCSCFSEMESSNQQDVMVVNSTQFQVISTANVEAAIMTIEETSYQIVQNHRPQQYHVMKTNEPTVDYIPE